MYRLIRRFPSSNGRHPRAVSPPAGDRPPDGSPAVVATDAHLLLGLCPPHGPIRSAPCLPAGCLIAWTFPWSTLASPLVLACPPFRLHPSNPRFPHLHPFAVIRPGGARPPPPGTGTGGAGDLPAFRHAPRHPLLRPLRRPLALGFLAAAALLMAVWRPGPAIDPRE